MTLQVVSPRKVRHWTLRFTTNTIVASVIASFVLGPLLLLYMQNAHRTRSLNAFNSRRQLEHAEIIESHVLETDPSIYPLHNVKLDRDELNRRNITGFDYAVMPDMPQWTDEDTRRLASPWGEQWKMEMLTKPMMNSRLGPSKVSLKQMTVNLRTMKSLHTYFDERGIRSPEQVRHRDLAAWHLLHQLVDRHLEWLKKGYSDIFDVQRQSMTEKRGFAMCVGDNKFAYAVHALAALREVHGNELPVEIFFRDDDDLSKRYQQYLLSKFANIRLRRLDQIFENYILELRGWDMKPFSVLASSFKEVMLIDADALFLYNPDKLFDEQGFKDTGTLFFKDRTLLQWPRFGGRQWVESFLPSYSDWLPKSRWWMGESDFELHSPVVLFDKQKTLWSIIAACKLMDKWEREQQTFVYSHGDKEAFWLGAEMTLTPFTFVSGVPMALGGFIEGVMENGYVCGTVALPDSTGRPFWWNGGMYHTAFGQRRIIQFDFYALGSYHVSGPECMMERDFIYDLPEEAAQAGKEHVDIVKRYKVDLALLHQGAYPLV